MGAIGLPVLTGNLDPALTGQILGCSSAKNGRSPNLLHFFGFVESGQ